MAQFYLGLCYYDLSDGSGKDSGKAVYWYEQAAAQGHAGSQFKLGLMYMKGVGVPEDIKKAAQLIRQAANQGHEQASAELANSLNPQNAGPGVPASPARGAVNRGNAHSDLGQYQKAIDDYSEAIRLDPLYACAYLNRGYAYHDLNQDEKAIQDYSLAIEVKPDYAGAYFHRGNAYQNLKQYEKAIQDYKHALEIDPSFYDAKVKRDIAYKNLKQ